jgi:hypothetical protein
VVITFRKNIGLFYFYSAESFWVIVAFAAGFLRLIPESGLIHSAGFSGETLQFPPGYDNAYQ